MKIKDKMLHNPGGTTKSIAEQFKPLVYILTAVSPYQVEIAKCDGTGDGDQVMYRKSHVTCRRPLSLYPVILLLWYIFVGIFFATNFGLDVAVPFRLGAIKISGNGTEAMAEAMDFGTNRLTMVYMGFAKAVENIVIFANSPGLVSWLMSLDILEKNFNKFGQLGVRLGVDVCVERNILIGLYLLLPSFFWMVHHCWALLPYFCFPSGGLLFRLLSYLWYFSCPFLIFCQTSLLEDVKTMLMLITVGKIYKKMRFGIMEDSHRLFHVAERRITCWKSFLTALRRQVEATGEHLKSQLLISVGEILIVSSVGLYLTLLFLREGTGSVNMGYVTVSGFHILFSALRLYLKVYFAERIYYEESLLCEYLLDIDTEEFRTTQEVRTELRALYQLLLHKPSRVNLGNYTVLDKNLLIQVAVQSVTMLIAVAQFHSS